MTSVHVARQWVIKLFVDSIFIFSPTEKTPHNALITVKTTLNIFLEKSKRHAFSHHLCHYGTSDMSSLPQITPLPLLDDPEKICGYHRVRYDTKSVTLNM